MPGENRPTLFVFLLVIEMTACPASLLRAGDIPDVPVVIVRTTGDAAGLILPAVMAPAGLLSDTGGEGEERTETREAGFAEVPEDVPLYFAMSGGPHPDSLPMGTWFCRLPYGVDEGSQQAILADLRRNHPQVVPVLPVTRPFEVLNAPPGGLLEVPEADSSPGWLVYRQYMVATRKARFIVPSLTEAEILLGAVAGALPGERKAEAQRDLAALYALIWLGGGYGRVTPDEGALFLLPERTGISEESLPFLAGMHRAALEAGFLHRILLAGEVAPADVLRYRMVVVPDASGLSTGTCGALLEVAERGGVVVLVTPGGPRLAEAAGLRSSKRGSRVVRRFERTEPPLPQVGYDGLSRCDRGLEAAGCQVFIGTRTSPVITLKRVGAGYFLVLNVDFASYRRISTLGLSGAEQVREVLRWCLARAGLSRLAGVEGTGRRGLWELMGAVPVAAARESWYSLLFVANGREGACYAQAWREPQRMPRRVYGAGGAVVEGAFSRRVEWLTATCERLRAEAEDEAENEAGEGTVLVEGVTSGVGNGSGVAKQRGKVLLRVRAGGLRAGSVLPVLVETLGESDPRRGRLEPVMYRRSVELAAPAGAFRLLVRDLLFSFRALAAVY